MSSINRNNADDLIDLNVGSPELPRSSPLILTIQNSSAPTPSSSTSSLSSSSPHPSSSSLSTAAIASTSSTTQDNLIDTELPILEQKLQTATNNNNNVASSESRRTSVDVEDILISIDDDCDTTTTTPTPNRIIQRSNSESFLDLDEANAEANGLYRSLSCDNLEALIVLKHLDDILNASLQESNRILNEVEPENGNSDENNHQQQRLQQQESVEECLLDLDNYLKALDSSCDEHSHSSICVDDQPSICSNSSLQDLNNHTDSTESTSVVSGGAEEEASCTSTSTDALRNQLRHLEENYSKFYGCVNRGFVDSENNNIGDIESEYQRPLSACGMPSEAISKNHPAPATVAVMRRERPTIPFNHNISNYRRKDNASRCTLNRTSAPLPAGDSDEDIDWSWLQDVARDVTMERRAHASGERCTGTVIVEPLYRQTKPSNSTNSHPEAVLSENDKELSRTWLRNSMRRLRHLRMPSDFASQNENTPSNPPRVMETPVTSTPIAGNAARPVSAPSRLPPNIASTTIPNNSSVTRERSRSRSRESRQSGVSHEPSGRARSSSASSRSRRPRSLSSSESSLASSVESTPSCTQGTGSTNQESSNGNTNNTRRPCERPRHNDMPEADSPLGHWPHSLSSMMACLGCSLGLFNISRFAILTIHFGANFIFQFFLLSLVFGLPLFSLQMCLGQQLGSGVIDMWRISPLFQGVGVSLLIAQGLIGLYSIVGISWMFVFFRDSFITKFDKYRWAEPFLYYRNENPIPLNGSYKLTETVPDYFNGVVLQRHHLADGTAYGTIKFQLAFNLAVVWMIVFVSLSKGLRSYGKVIYAFTLLPVFCTFVLCAKILGLMPPEYVNIIFPETSWSEFFLNPKSWLAAGQEVFLTWGLLGAAVMQIASHNKHKHLLQRDSSLVAVITFTILLLVAFLANTCVQILRSYGYNYVPSSFEKIGTYSFLRPISDPLPPNLANTPVRYMIHNSFILGEKVVKPGAEPAIESGYQVLRLATELVPATFAVVGPDQVSPFWAVLFYFILIMFGIAQQLAIWHCVITGIMAIKAKVLKSWETTITFFSCACGFILGLPLATEIGIYVVYFMDYTIGGTWWLILVILLQIIAVFMVRGRPYSGDNVVTALFHQNNNACLLSWAPALLSFTWNVILPVGLMVLCISTFNNGKYSRELFMWHQHYNIAKYFPLTARQIGSMLQLLPILCVPLVAVIQSYRYLNNGPNDILERIQLLYRPPIGEHMEDVPVEAAAATVTSTTNASATITNEDPPPKYTPPPSYTTATGARIAKFLRQSIRRSVRRLATVLGESSTSRQRAAIATNNQESPPDYNAVVVEMNQADVAISMPDSAPPPPRRLSTLERLRNLQPSSSALTAAEVASILRSSFRRSTVRGARSNVRNANFNNDSSSNVGSMSAENLVDSAAPIGETSLVLDQLSNNNNNNSNNEQKAENLSSVI